MPTKQHFERKSADEPIFDEKGFPRGKTQNETGEAVEVSVFVPWGALSTLSTRSREDKNPPSHIHYSTVTLLAKFLGLSTSFPLKTEV